MEETDPDISTRMQGRKQCCPRIYRGRKEFFQQQRWSRGFGGAFGDRDLALSGAHGLENREGKVGSYLRVLLLSPLLHLTDIPHIYNDNMQTFTPGGK